MKKGYLVLADGTVFEGSRFGADLCAAGELVFTTGVVGYGETLTDPAFYGQIVLQTYPMIGNYGIIEEDLLAKPALSAYVVREYCETPSNFRCDMTVDAYLRREGIPGLCGVDTRAITRHIREHGVMNAMLCDEIPADLASLQGRDFAEGGVVTLTCKSVSEIPAQGEEIAHAALLDLGAAEPLIAQLSRKGVRITRFPATAAAEDILAAAPDGLVLSAGPGNPAEVDLTALKGLIYRLPVFGVGLGHQVLALAHGGKTEKLKYGHRGANQPVTEPGGNTHITAQNHGYAVLADSLAGTAEVLFKNENDGSCEGLVYKNHRSFSVQFAPETCRVPRDLTNLYDRFINEMKGVR
ncbi:MAG: carbamoyl phosphate synthase small subunit [Clostridia bacterium]|nr:carbamoyl phosphate synthase small subunit [Clostridia bacterium]